MNTLALLLIPLAFGLNPVIGRALHATFEPGTLAVCRWSISALVVLMLALARGRRERWRASVSQYASLIGLGMAGMGFCAYAAYAAAQTSTATTIGLIYACTAALVAAYEIACGRARATLALLAGLMLCVIGVAVLLTRGDFQAFATQSLGRGELWAIAGTAVWAIYSVAMRSRASILTPLAGFAIMSTAGMLAMVPFMFWELQTHPLPELDRTLGLWIAALALITGVAGFMGYNWSLARNGAILTAASISLSPIYIAGLAVVLIGEEIVWFHGVALALVTLGLIAINVARARG